MNRILITILIVNNTTVDQRMVVQEKTELWLKDATGFKVLVEAWGRTFARELGQETCPFVLCLLNFAVKGDASQVSLTGEYVGDSVRGSSCVLPLKSDVAKAPFDGVEAAGGTEISVPWKPAVSNMSADGPCYAAFLASVRNSSLAFGDGELRPVAPGSQDVWLPEEVRVFVGGVWLTDIRDAEVLYTPCSVCKKKISESGKCSNPTCTGEASDVKAVLTTVTLADATGSLHNVLIRTDDFLVFTGMKSIQDLESCLQQEGHVSLPFRRRADVILGAQKATQHGMAQSGSGEAQSLSPLVVSFEVLRVLPTLLEGWSDSNFLVFAPDIARKGNKAQKVWIPRVSRVFVVLDVNCVDFLSRAG